MAYQELTLHVAAHPDTDVPLAKIAAFEETLSTGMTLDMAQLIRFAADRHAVRAAAAQRPAQ